MLKRLLLLTAVGIMMSGCILITPIALIGPATSGFSTASIAQTAITQYGNYLVKINTGKTIPQHAWGAIENGIVKNTIVKRSVAEEILQQAYFPKKNISELESAP